MVRRCRAHLSFMLLNLGEQNQSVFLANQSIVALPNSYVCRALIITSCRLALDEIMDRFFVVLRASIKVTLQPDHPQLLAS